jgi:hypothetical protein
MSGASWNILDDRGCRIAVCGYDDDHEKSGPAIARELVALQAMRPSPFRSQVESELASARAKHARLNSAHEAYAVILEELDEFWDQVRLRREQRDKREMLKELIQVAAMAQRAAEDLELIEE